MSKMSALEKFLLVLVLVLLYIPLAGLAMQVGYNTVVDVLFMKVAGIGPDHITWWDGIKLAIAGFLIKGVLTSHISFKSDK